MITKQFHARSISLVGNFPKVTALIPLQNYRTVPEKFNFSPCGTSLRCPLLLVPPQNDNQTVRQWFHFSVCGTSRIWSSNSSRLTQFFLWNLSKTATTACPSQNASASILSFSVWNLAKMLLTVGSPSKMSSNSSRSVQFLSEFAIRICPI